MKRIIALIMAVVSALSVMTFSASAHEGEAETVSVTVGDTEFIFDADTSEEFRRKAIAAHMNPEDDGAQTYGVICDLLGHKCETETVISIIHNARTSSPRCLKRTYIDEVCTRCDYVNRTLIGNEYIECC
ncbi:MAG: hypothetical protein IJB16_10375 [Clostridia bacterium]|nr:hypothetical protein [Clostridia bacterium]